MNFIKNISNSQLYRLQPAILSFSGKISDTEKKIREFLIAELEKSNLSEDEKKTKLALYKNEAIDFPLTYDEVAHLSKDALNRNDSFAGLFTADTKKRETTLRGYLSYIDNKEKALKKIKEYLYYELYQEAIRSGKGHMRDRAAEADLNRSSDVVSRAGIDSIDSQTIIVSPKYVSRIQDIIRETMKAEIPGKMVNDMLWVKELVSLSGLMAAL